MATRLEDLPADLLAKMLRDTERAAGVDCVSAKLIRRALERKQAEAAREQDLRERVAAHG